MKKLFVYFSYTGSGDAVAEKLANQGYDLQKVLRKKPLSKSFFLAMLKGGFLAGTGHKDKLVGYEDISAQYDEVVIGSPIWNGRIASPVNTVLASLDPSGKRLSFVLYAGGGEAPKAVKRLEKAYPGCRIVVLKEPKKYPAELEKLNEF